jgi:hypothetical protein
VSPAMTARATAAAAPSAGPAGSEPYEPRNLLDRLSDTDTLDTSTGTCSRAGASS